MIGYKINHMATKVGIVMSDEIVVQLKDLASTLKRGEGRSTVYGAASEIERLRAENEQLRNGNNLLAAMLTGKAVRGE